jgi:hypothetical protein
MGELVAWKSLPLAVVAVGTLFFCAYGLGSVIAKTGARSALLRLAVGLNSCAVLGLIFSPMPQPLPVSLLVALATLAWICLGLYREIRPPRGLHVRPTMLGLAGLFAIAITLGPALTYPSGWDELVYHITLPMRWLSQNELSVMPDLPYSGLPSLAEILFWLTSPCEQLIAPRLIAWTAWLIGLGLWYATLRLDVSAESANFWTWAMCASPVMLMISQNCYVESLAWMNMAGILYLLRRAELGIDQVQFNFAILLGVLIGGAMAIKLTLVGLLCLPVLLVLAPISIDRQRKTWFISPRVPRGTKPAMQAILVAFAFALPFYLRPWIEVGNPFFPFFESWFTNDAARCASSAYHHEIASGNFGIVGVMGWIVAPLGLAYASEVYDSSFGFQWLLVIAFIAPMMMTENDSQRQRANFSRLILGAVLYAIWCASSQQARFAIPLYALITSSVAIHVSKLSSHKRLTTQLVLFALTFVSVPWRDAGYYLESWQCVLNQMEPNRYIRNGTGDSYADLAQFLNTRVASHERVLTLFEHRSLYLPTSTRIGTPYFQSQYFSASITPESTQRILDELDAHQIRWIVLPALVQGPDTSSRWIERQQAWAGIIDGCVQAGDLEQVWASEEHVVLLRTP